MSKNIKSFLQFITLDEIDYWDVKRYTISSVSSTYQLVKLSNLIDERSEKIKLFEYPEKEFGILGVNNKEGLFDAYLEKGENINQSYKKVHYGDLAYNPYRINVGSIGLKSNMQKNNFISPAYVVFSSNEKLNPNYLYKIFKTDIFNKIINDNTTGSVRQNLKFDTLSNIKIPLPSLEEQNILLEKYNDKILLAQKQEIEAKEIEDSIEEYLLEELGIEKIESKVKSSKLQFIESRTVFEWGVDKIVSVSNFKSDKYNISSLQSNEKLYIDLFRGKSPKYSNDSNAIILNQKCNRWNDIALEYVKTVDKNWLKNINIDFFTQENDILINSTGEGTIGRATSITKEYENYLYDSHLLLLRLNQEQVNSQYYVYLFNSIYGQQQVENIKSAQATKQTELGIANLKKISFPLPPIDIQLKIVEEINIRTKQIKQLKQEAISNRENAIKEFENEIFNEA